MASTSDVRDILEIEGDGHEFMTKDALFNNDQKKKKKKSDIQFKRPEGMHRELWGLLWTDNIGWNTFSGEAPPIIPTDTHTGYKQMKAKIGRSRVRPWKWMTFNNPARKDGAVFYHWRRVADEGKDYPFAKFNKTVDMPMYTDIEYQQHLHDDNWSRQETDYLFDMCKRFDLRFVIICDRWDRDTHTARSVEDLKERYYSISNILGQVRAAPGMLPKMRAFDADHERRRKEQLSKLFDRTPEQVEEEQYLLGELKKIEMRKKEREKKTQDLQKLITAADTNMESRRAERKATKKKLQEQRHKTRGDILMPSEPTGIKFPDFKQSGVTVRSQRMKLPGSVGQKKAKAIEQVLDELGIELNPIPTDDIVSNFNELRQDIVLLYELKLALANCEYELQTLRHRFETLAPGKMPDLGLTLTPSTEITTSPATPVEVKIESPVKVVRKISETIDVVGNTPITPNRKRRAAMEQTNILKKLKKF